MSASASATHLNNLPDTVLCVARKGGSHAVPQAGDAQTVRDIPDGVARVYACRYPASLSERRCVALRRA